MHRDLVDTRAWVTTEEYKQGLALAQLAPGPLAAQLAMYLGWARRGCVGRHRSPAWRSSGPPSSWCSLLSACYLRFGGLAWMQGVFYGIGAAVIAIVARSALKLLRAPWAGMPVLWLIVAVNVALVAWTEAEILWVFAASGLAGLLVELWRERGSGPERSRPRWSRVARDRPGWPRVDGHAGPDRRLLRQGGHGGLRQRPRRGAVPARGRGRDFGWLTERQFLDAVAVSMITPGPVVITVAFIGYLVAGPLGGLVAAIGMFLPTYLAVVAGRAVVPPDHRQPAPPGGGRWRHGGGDGGHRRRGRGPGPTGAGGPADLGHCGSNPVPALALPPVARAPRDSRRRRHRGRAEGILTACQERPAVAMLNRAAIGTGCGAVR